MQGQQGADMREPRSTSQPGSRIDTKVARRAARVRIGTYHEDRLAELVEHVRDALACYDAGEIDVFDLDDVIHRYKKAARELWKFCSGTGSDALFAARALDVWEADGELPDWWEAGAPRPRG